MFIEAVDDELASVNLDKFLGSIQARHVINIVINDNPYSILLRVVLGNFLLRNNLRHFLFTTGYLRLMQST